MKPELLEELEKLCAQREWTVGLAESCTGGLLSTSICERAGVSKLFKGSIVCYARDVKQRILNVRNSLMQVHGEVSLPVAIEMARGARDVLDCDWAVSITGIAGPSGGSPEKPVGTVCFAVAGPGSESFETKHFPSEGSRKEIQRQAASHALEFLLRVMHE